MRLLLSLIPIAQKEGEVEGQERKRKKEGRWRKWREG